MFQFWITMIVLGFLGGELKTVNSSYVDIIDNLKKRNQHNPYQFYDKIINKANKTWNYIGLIIIIPMFFIINFLHFEHEWLHYLLSFITIGNVIHFCARLKQSYIIYNSGLYCIDTYMDENLAHIEDFEKLESVKTFFINNSIKIDGDFFYKVEVGKIKGFPYELMKSIGKDFIGKYGEQEKIDDIHFYLMLKTFLVRILRFVIVPTIVIYLVIRGLELLLS